MKKLLLTTLLCFCVNAYAFNWVKIGIVKGSDGADIYLDTENIKKMDNFIYFWVLLDAYELQHIVRNE